MQIESYTSGILTGQTPYEEVARIFEGFRVPDERGGVVRTGKIPYLNALAENSTGIHSDNKYSTNYHVQMSFSPEQRKYIVTVLAHMNALVNGVVLGAGERTVPFAERVQDRYLKARDTSYYDFHYAVENSCLELLGEFGTRYPNLMPATLPMMEVAGTQGLLIVINNSSSFLAAASRGRLRGDNIEEFLRGHECRSNFILAHPWAITQDIQPKEYEVWCSGEAFAKLLTRQSAQAAVNLVLAGVHDCTGEIEVYTTGTVGKITDLVCNLARVAKTEHRTKPNPIRRVD